MAISVTHRLRRRERVRRTPAVLDARRPPSACRSAGAPDRSRSAGPRRGGSRGTRRSRPRTARTRPASATYGGLAARSPASSRSRACRVAGQQDPLDARRRTRDSARGAETSPRARRCTGRRRARLRRRSTSSGAGSASDVVSAPRAETIPACSRSQVAAVTPASRRSAFAPCTTRCAAARGELDEARHPVPRHARATGSRRARPDRAPRRPRARRRPSPPRRRVLVDVGILTATAATSFTSGMASTSASTSNDEMFSPRRRITSFIRSRKKKFPSSSWTNWSPVWNQPLRQAFAVASGMFL